MFLTQTHKVNNSTVRTQLDHLGITEEFALAYSTLVVAEL